MQNFYNLFSCILKYKLYIYVIISYIWLNFAKFLYFLGSTWHINYYKPDLISIITIYSL